jgi:hypothetical protein
LPIDRGAVAVAVNKEKRNPFLGPDYSQSRVAFCGSVFLWHAYGCRTRTSPSHGPHHVGGMRTNAGTQASLSHCPHHDVAVEPFLYIECDLRAVDVVVRLVRAAGIDD